MFTSPIGYLLLAMAIGCLAAALFFNPHFSILALLFACWAGWYERDYPSGF